MSVHDETSLEQLRRAVLRQRLRQRGEAAMKPSAQPIPSVSRSERLPLSFAQQRLWLVSALDKDADRAYYLPSALRLRGTLDRAALQHALDGLVARHESLRTRFVTVDGVPYQEVVSPAPAFALREQHAASEQGVTQAIADELNMPFDLANGPLVRGRLLSVSEQEHVLLLTLHHIVSDGWSSAVMVRELATLYRAACLGEADSLPPLPIQYVDYAHWQRQQLQGARLSEQLDFWRGHLAGAPELLELPLDRPRPPTPSHAGGQCVLSVPAPLAEGLRALAQRHGATLYMVLMAAWSLLLSRLSGQSTVVVATPVAGRGRRELEGLIGFFVNTLALCTRLDDEQSVAQLIDAVRHATLAAFTHQELPFEQVVEAVRPARSLSHAPLAQASFTWHNEPEGQLLALPELSLQAIDIVHPSTQADLSLHLSDAGATLEGRLVYARDLFDEMTVARWGRCFLRVLESFVADETQPALRVPLLAQDDYRQVVDDFNLVPPATPSAGLAHACFERWVDAQGDVTALSCEGDTLSYRELDERANRLAHYLLVQGTQPDDRVALCVERGLDFLVGVLGILKAGGAYVPLDPEYPSARLAYMLGDSAPRLVLTQSSVAEQLPPVDVPVLRLDVDVPVLTRHLPSTRPELPALQPSHLAYLIYTSGSTGEPKAVMVEHRQLCHLSAAQQAVFGDLHGARVLQFASLSFDASVWEWAMALLAGGTLVLAPRHRLLPGDALLASLRDHAITHVTLPGSALQTLGEAELPSLRTLVVAGEACPVALAERWRERVAFFNAYGPTEGTVCASIERCLETHAYTVPIGRPLPNTRLHVLDARGEVVPVGVVGEIHLGGAGVTRGYWGREALTAERFIDDRVGASGARLYRTGDLGRYRADGRLECLGRVDFQVKLRGHRIEIGEIETRLEALPGVAEAAVLLEGEGASARLVAYWTPAGEAEESAASLRAQLASRLPDYMLPSALVRLAQLPRTGNGKLDRAALPTYESGAVAQREYEAPQGEVEETLARLWQELLEVPRVGRHDHFFELGGHSLLAVTLVERLRQDQWDAEVRALFVAPTLSGYAATLAPARATLAPRLAGIPADTAQITPELLPLVELSQAQIDRIAETVPGGAANIQDICPLLPMQSGMLFHHLLQRDGDPYLSCTVIAFTQRARLDDFVRIFNRLIARHDILRISLAWEGLAQPVQVIWRDAPLPVHELEVPDGTDAQALLAIHTDSRQLRLDLKRAPLLAAYVAYDRVRDEWLLGFVSHHLVVDHRSLELLMGELRQWLADESMRLPPSLPLREQVAAAMAVSAEAHERYFREQLGDIDEPTAPFGLLDVQQRAGSLALAQRMLAPAQAQRLRDIARTHQVPAAVLLHVAYALVLSRCCGRDDVVFGTVLAGRMHGADGADTALGMFVNTLPLRVRLAQADAPTLLRNCYRDLAELLEHEQAPLALAQRMSGVPSDRPLFTALLNYRHNATAEPATADESAGGIRIVADYGDHATYPLTLKINDFGTDFGLTAECAGGLDAGRMLDYLERAIEGLLQSLESGVAMSGFTLLDAAEQQQLVEGFNQTARVYPRDSSLHAQFALRVAERPDAIALECAGEQLTYRELDQRANRLAHYLVGLGVGPDNRVAIVLPRGIDMVLAMLAVLKAGGAYVPLDPQQPRERMAWLLSDTQPTAVLSASDWEERLPALDVPVLRFDVECAALLQRPTPDAPQVPALHAEHLCYVMYTSGSTGQPKGVMVEHRQVLRLVLDNPYCTLGADDVVAHAANPAFDASTWEIWGALLSGARLLIVPQEDLLSPSRLVECLRAGRVNALWLSVGLFNQYEEALRPILGQLRYLLVGGDALDPTVMARVMQAEARPRHVLNGYGPTESTTFACTHELVSDDLDGRPIPIGRPIGNTRVYILGAGGEVLPSGAAGEIHISGDGVARGYWNQPERTRERFVPDPFVPGARMYRSGDRGRYRADGTIEYLGRADGQVKIRGFRVETGEIETALRALPDVAGAAVLVHAPEAGEKSLIAYVVPVDGVADDERVRAWRAQLGNTLPDYMLPTAFVPLTALPLNANGKLDRRALPSPEAGLRATGAYRAPEGDTEIALAEIWQQLLELPRIGRDDDFFALGGHSLLAVTLSVHVQERFHVELPLKTVFEVARLEQLARAIEAAQLALPSAQDLSDMQAELAALSDEELQAFLGDTVE